MRTFYYKAYDQKGLKKSGVIEAPHREGADAELRNAGLRPYLLQDYFALKKMLREKQKKRTQKLVMGGVVAVIAAAVFSGTIVWYAGRERAPDIESYKQSGIVAGNPGLINAKTREEREFGQGMYQIWHNFCPGSVSGLEVSRVFMTVYVTRKIRDLSQNDLEMLGSNTVRQLQKRFGATSCQLWVAEGNTTILEVSYTGLTKTTRVKHYR